MVATTLTRGSLGLVSYETDQTAGAASPDALRFVLTRPIGSGTVIYFTDRAWTGAAFTNAAGDGTYTYTAATDLAAGAVITLSGSQLTSGGITLSNNGETIYAYQGTGPDAPTTFLFAMDVADGNTTFNGNLTNTGLSVGNGAVAIAWDNASFAGSATQIPQTMFTNISTNTQWHGSDQDDIAGTTGYSEVFDTTVGNPGDNIPNNDTLFNAADMVMIAGMAGGGQSDAILRVGNDEGANVGSNLTRLFQDNPAFNHISDVSFDLENGFFFFVDSDGNNINRIMRGSTADLVSGNQTPTFTQIFATDGLSNGTGTAAPGELIVSMEINTATNKIYWMDGDIFGDFEGGFQFWESNYDGTGQRLITTIDTENPDPNFGFPGGVSDFVVYNAGNVAYIVSSTSSVDGFGNATVNQNHVLEVNLTTGNVNYLNLGTSPAGYSPGRLDPTNNGQIIGIDVDQRDGSLYFVTQPISPSATAGIFHFVPGSIPAGTTSGATINGTLTELWVQPSNNAYNTLQTFPTANMTNIEFDEVGNRYYVTATSDTDTENDNTPATNESDASIFIGNPAGGAPTLFVRAYEPTANGAPNGMEIDYAATVSVTSAGATYTESTTGPGSPAGTPVSVLTGATVADPDNTMVQGATIAITNNFLVGDTLAFTAANGITGSYNSANGVLTLSGAATLAQYQAALASVTYTNAGDNPTNYGAYGDRTISFQTFDGLAYSDPASATVTVVGRNDAPVNTVGATLNVTEDGPVLVTGVSVSDPDADPATQAITVTLAVQHGTLNISTSTTGGITGANITGGAQGSSTITITATQNQINATLAANPGLIYSPSANYNGGDGLTVTTVDNGFSGTDPGLTGTAGNEQDVDTKTFAIAAVNDAPVVTGSGNQTSATILEDTPSATGETVSSLFASRFSDATDAQFDATTNPTGSNANGFAGIAVVTNGSTAGTGQWQYYNGTTWVNIGTASTAAAVLLNANTALRFAPAANYNGAEPNLVVQLVDDSGGAITSGATVNISAVGATGGTTRYSSGQVTLTGTITAVNDPSVISNLNNDSSTYVENAAPLQFDSGTQATITDVDSADYNGGSLTVSITANKNSAQDVLGILANGTTLVSLSDGTNAGSIVTVNGSAIGTIRSGGDGVSGHDLIIDLNANATTGRTAVLIRALTYANNSDAPTAATRDITVTLVDGDGTANGGNDTASAVVHVGITPVNDAPVLVADSGSASFVEGDNAPSTPVAVSPGLTLSDPDNATLSSATVSITGNFVSGQDILAFTNSSAATYGNITAAYNAGSGVLTLTSAGATATVAQFNAALDAVTYTNSSDTPNSAPRTVSFVANDGTASSTPVTRTVTVTAVDDSPIAVGDAGGTSETSPTTISVLTNDTDVDGGTKGVTQINGSSATVGTPVTLASGATATLNNDGTITYNPNGRFTYLVSPATAAALGASDGQATDTFTYTLNGGSAATVTVTVTGVDNAGSELRGTSGADSLGGTGNPELYNLSQGGNDTVNSGGGDDGIYFGAAFNGQDNVNGGAGTLDQLGLQGDYGGDHALALSATSLVGIENLVLLSGSNTQFGDTANNRYSYNITAVDANVAAGQFVAISANTLLAGENVTFDGHLEQDGSWVYYAGLGTDQITGGQQSDGFFFAQGRWDSTDSVDGQGGNFDQLALQGNYVVSFGETQLTSIENLVLISSTDVNFGGGSPYTYNITLANGNVAAGAFFAISANTLDANETFTLNASAETDAGISVYSGAGNDTLVLGQGADHVFGGAGADAITGNGGADQLFGGAGNDSFIYLSASDSTAAQQDHILDFVQGDLIDVHAIGSFTLIASGQAFTGANQLRITDNGNGTYLVEGETTGDGQADLSILVNSSGDLTASDFVGVTSPGGATVDRAPAYAPDHGSELHAAAPLPLSALVVPVETADVHMWHVAGQVLLPDVAPSPDFTY